MHSLRDFILAILATTFIGFFVAIQISIASPTALFLTAIGVFLAGISQFMYQGDQPFFIFALGRTLQYVAILAFFASLFPILA